MCRDHWRRVKAHAYRGIAITSFYALVVAGLLLPVVYVLTHETWPKSSHWYSLYDDWLPWTWIALLVGGQALLLFLSVDASHTPLKPRAHVLVSITLAGLFIALLTFAASTSVYVAAYLEDKRPDWADSIFDNLLILCLALWLFWTGFFYLHLRDSSQLVKRGATRLLRGSVLELLIAIPCHLIIRQRNECTSPFVTSFGVVTGIAIMLMSFGPSVLLLYKKRLDQYQK